jgi:hypothetical protein
MDVLVKMNMDSIIDVINVYFGEPESESMILVHGATYGKEFIRLFCDKVIPGIYYHPDDDPGEPEIKYSIDEVQICPFKSRGRDASDAVFEVFETGGTQIIKTTFRTAIELTNIFQKYYPHNLTGPILKALYHKDAPKREKKYKENLYRTTKSQIIYDEKDAILLINNAITMTNRISGCDVAVITPRMFLMYLTEMLNDSNIMEKIEFPTQKPRD